MHLRIIAVLFGLALAAQPPAPSKKISGGPPTFKLGETFQATMARFGTPRYYIDGRSGTVIPPSRYPRLMAIYPLAVPVYFRKTPTNEYELRLSSYLDDSQSRLRPTERLRAVYFRLDRPRPLIEIASDILEVAALCRQRCSVKATDWVHESIILTPGVNQSVATFILTDELSLGTGQSPARDWLSRPVYQVRFEPYSADALPPEDRKWTTAKVLDLGTWQPGSEFKFAVVPPRVAPPRGPEDPPFLTHSPIESPRSSDQPIDGIGGVVFRVGGSVSAPLLVFRVEPEHTEAARKAKYQGTVVLDAVIDEKGKVRDLKVIRALGFGLDEKAIEAVRQWKFRPGIKYGKPVSVAVQIEVSFRDLP